MATQLQLTADQQRLLALYQKARKARTHLLENTRLTFGVGYRVNWHHEVICRTLDWWVKTPHARLIIEAPPQHGKTTLVSVHLPAMIFGNNPDARLIAVSYADSLAQRNSRHIQNVMAGEAYKALYPGVRLASGKASEGAVTRTSSEFEVIGHKGIYRCAGVGGSVTGYGADYLIVDDPVKNRAEAESANQREATWSFFTSTARTRLRKGGRILVTMTRWHEDDLVGRLVKAEEEDPKADKWVRLRLPALCEESKHPEDPRQEGEALWPDEYDESYLRTTAASIGTYDFDALYQARPHRPGGSKIHRDWFKIIDGSDVSPGLTWYRYWDLAVSRTTQADWTASVEGAVDDRDCLYLRWMVRVREEWPEVQKIMVQTADNEVGVPIGVESVGTQKGFVQSLQRVLRSSSVVGYNVATDKLTRALPWIARAERGQVFLVRGSWVADFLDECVKFTGSGSGKDDQVDAVSGVYQMACETMRDFVA